jgi:DNA-binding response OmpR family regulator
LQVSEIFICLGCVRLCNRSAGGCPLGRRLTSAKVKRVARVWRRIAAIQAKSIKDAAKLMMYPKLTVAIVEDDDNLSSLMSFALKHAGFKVKIFENAALFYRFLAFNPTIIAVLDIGLIGEDGLSVCRYLRSRDLSMGIVIVTGRVEREEKLSGLMAGADAYLKKPVDMDELVLVLERLALRFLSKPADAEPVKKIVLPGHWHMGMDPTFVTSPNGVRVRLSVSEAQLLRVLLSSPGAACSHTELGWALGMLGEDFDKHRIEVIISRMRIKVGRSAGIPLPVESCRGFGYRLRTDT